MIADFSGLLVILDPDRLGEGKTQTLDLILRRFAADFLQPPTQRLDLAALVDELFAFMVAVEFCQLVDAGLDGGQRRLAIACLKAGLPRARVRIMVSWGVNCTTLQDSSSDSAN